MAFPIGAYAKYKQATDFFLHWLLLARGRGKRVAGAGDGAALSLDAFRAVALEACRSAATLRERVSLYFVGKASSAEMQRHQHFLQLLHTWHGQLRAAAASARESSGKEPPGPLSNDRFANYYEVLALDDDYFDQSDAAAAIGDALVAAEQMTPKQCRAERAALFNDAFAQDLLFEVATYLLEAEHAESALVKQHKKTLVEASAVVKVAMQCAESLTARLQQRYPSLELAADMLTVLADKMAAGFNASRSLQERACFRTRDLSRIFRLLVECDMSVLGHGINAASAKILLAEVSRVCARELFDTRVLSCDMLRLNDDRTDLFSELCDALGRRAFNDAYLATPAPGVARQYQVNRALEDAVMVPLVAFLDCYECDGTIDLSALAGYSSLPMHLVDPSAVTAHCRTAAEVIARQFASLPTRTLEARYFLFPAQPDFARQAFGTATFTEVTPNASRNRVFSDLMDVLEESSGPPSARETQALKAKIKQDPELLVMLSVVTATGAAAASARGVEYVKSELCTLLRYATAGAAHDMAGLYNQPTVHCREEPDPRARVLPKAHLPNQMAVHSAAVVGHTDIVRLLLEADIVRDLNTRTYQTKETLAHLAVRSELAGLGADVHIKDGRDRSMADLTDDAEWKRAITDKIRTLEASNHAAEAAKNRDAMFRHQDDRRDRERAGAGASAARPAAAASRVAFPDRREFSAERSASPLFDAVSKVDDEHKRASAIDELPAKFASVIGSSQAVADMCATVQRLVGLVVLLVRKDRIYATQRSLRVQTASQGAQTVHLLQKFHRATSVAFDRFAIATAQLLALVERVPQACELLDLLEKRLLGAYSTARVDAGLGKAATADSLRRLAWYCSNLVESYTLQLNLDAIYGHAMYSTVQRSVMFWSDATDAHVRVMEKVFSAAAAEGVAFQVDHDKLHTTELRIGAFVFSETGVVREA
ncbi:hypothetical protein PybrP1_010987 [[Pythium] brassicae (nom. inval.)]|nr:hypothetical protein PybrP1_010987 [[Pythium] brassicae (nom. inval.)]